MPFTRERYIAERRRAAVSVSGRLDTVVRIMKLTVGPLPATIYWRRRAVLLGVLLVVVVMFWASCSGPPAKSDARPNGASATGSSSPAATPTSTELTPIVASGQPSSGPSGGAAPPAHTTGTASVTVSCADADLQLTAAPETAVAPNGAYLRLKLKIKNISGRACLRDLGSDHQELYILSGTTKMWSSDACNAFHGSNLTVMQPNIEHLYENNWNGTASSAGCTNRQPPGQGKYQLFARLDNMISPPATIQLT
jgi:hypothetical protein